MQKSALRPPQSHFCFWTVSVTESHTCVTSPVFVPLRCVSAACLGVRHPSTFSCLSSAGFSGTSVPELQTEAGVGQGDSTKPERRLSPPTLRSPLPLPLGCLGFISSPCWWDPQVPPGRPQRHWLSAWWRVRRSIRDRGLGASSPPCSFPCRADSSFNFMTFFFIFGAQFILAVIQAIGFSGWGAW